MSVETERFDYVTAFTIKNGDDSWEKFLSIMTGLNDFLFVFISHSTFPTLLINMNSYLFNLLLKLKGKILKNIKKINQLIYYIYF